MQTKLLQEINDILKNFPEYWENTILQRELVIDDIKKKKNTKLLELFIANRKIKELYSTTIAGALVFDFEGLINLLRYKEYWQNSFTKYRNSVGLTSEGKYLRYNSDVVLDFPFKDCVLEGGMTKEDQGNDEVYYNEVIARDEIDRLFSPKVLSNVKRYTKDGVEEAITTYNDDDNLIIKGNNLIALHSLKARYAGKIKLIYIDPPYNTGNDSFKYNDRFNHSTWLTFMKNRLEVARELLSDDGVIFVQCDDNEQEYLKVLMDDIFDINNLIEKFYLQVRYSNKSLNEKDSFQKVIEQVYLYAKNKKQFVPNRPYISYDISKFYYAINELSSGRLIELGGRKVEIFDESQYKIHILESAQIDGLKETWASGSVLKGNTSGKFFDKYISKRKELDGLNCLYKVHGIGEDGIGYRYFTGPKKQDSIRGKFYSGIPLSRREELQNGGSKKFIPIVNFYDISGEVGNIRHEGGVALNAGKKPEKLLQRFIQITTNKDDIVLDYHLGSGTTAAVAHKMGRRYIGIEQIDYGMDSPWKRLHNVINGDRTGISKDVDWQGGGSFVYAELLERNAQYIHDIQKAQTFEELRLLFERMKETAHLNYQVELDKILHTEYEIDGVNHMATFEELPLQEQKQLLIELLDKNQLYVNKDDMNDATLGTKDSDKAFTRHFYGENE